MLKLGAISVLIGPVLHQKYWVTAIACTVVMHYDYNSIILALTSPLFLFLVVLLSLQRHLRFCYVSL
jgi:hypothetical protein